jgi:hypothetical protein
MKMTNQDLFEQLYESFNQRKIDDVLVFFDPAVDWPNGWEGGYVHGHEAVREYWTRQWAELDPIVKPLQIIDLENGYVRIVVQQVVKNKQGELLANNEVIHLYQFENGLIKKMIIMLT